jgi:hypothetical protein
VKVVDGYLLVKFLEFVNEILLRIGVNETSTVDILGIFFEISVYIKKKFFFKKLTPPFFLFSTYRIAHENLTTRSPQR